MVDAPAAGQTVLVPEVRFSLRNTGRDPQSLVQVNVTFRRQDEEDMWGSAWQRITPSGTSIGPGQSVPVSIRSDGRYTSELSPEEVFKSRFFKDVTARIFVRIGSSRWTQMTDVPVERRLAGTGGQPG